MIKRKLIWTEQAVQDLLAIGRFIAADNPAGAHAWVAALRNRACRAAALPGSGRMVPEFNRPELREVLHRKYRIVYRVTPEAVIVLTVFESHFMGWRDRLEEPRD